MRLATATDFPVPDFGDPLVNGTALVSAINAAQSAPGDDVILLDPGVGYQLDQEESRNAGQLAGNGTPIINSGVTIRGGFDANGAMTSIYRSGYKADFRLFSVGVGGRLKLNTVRISGGASYGVLNATQSCSAILNQGGSAQLFRAQVTLNYGTAICNLSDSSSGSLVTGLMAIEESTLNYNMTVSGTGGVYNEANLTIDRSTVASNDGGHFYAGGSAIGNGGITSVNADLTIRNSTISRNYTSDLVLGPTHVRFPTNFGGLRIQGGRASIEFSTIADNTGRGLSADANAVVTISNSIMSGNRAHPTVATLLDCDGTITSGGNNLVSSVDAGGAGKCNFLTASFDRTGTNSSPVDVRLGPLQSNGGFTETQALLSGSPAVRQAADSRNGCPISDQRNELRPRAPILCDIGAFQTSLTACEKDPNDLACTFDVVVRICATDVDSCRRRIMPFIDPLIRFPTLEKNLVDCRIDGPGCGPPWLNNKGPLRYEPKFRQ